MALPFEFVINRAPVSQQARRRELVRQWIRSVRDAAAQRWDAEPPFEGVVSVVITHFFKNNDAQMDVDNIAKPILDALKALVFSDDVQVIDLLCRKRQLGYNLRIHHPSPELEEYVGWNEEFVHIIVAESSALEVTF